MYIFGDGQEVIEHLAIAITARYNELTEQGLLSVDDAAMANRIMNVLIPDKFMKVIVHSKEDLKKKNEVSILDLIVNERYFAKDDDKMELSVMNCINLYGDITFGETETHNTIETIFGKRRHMLISDTVPAKFDPYSNYIFARNITRTVKDLNTDEERDEVYSELHIYQPEINSVIPIE